MKCIRVRLTFLITMLLLLSCLSCQVGATTSDDDCQQGHEQCGHDDGDSGTRVTVESGSVSHADSTSTSSAEATSSSGGNTQQISFSQPKSTTVRNVPSPDTPNVYPSAPCRIARSAGLSIAGGALSGGSSVEDVECTLRETARTFQSLGVPEVGLYLMCTQSLVVNGRYDKKGRLAEGVPPPLGPEECLRLVREFQGDVGDADRDSALTSEIQELREQQDRIEQQFADKTAELERDYEEARQVAVTRVPPVIRQETIQQPYLNDEKRSKLAALIGDNDEEEAK